MSRTARPAAVVPVAPVVESAPVAPITDVAIPPVVVPSSALAVLVVPVVAPVVVPVTPVVAAQVPAAVPTPRTSCALALVPAALPAPAAVQPAPIAAVIPPVDGPLPALPCPQSSSLSSRAMQGLKFGQGIAAPIVCGLAPAWPVGSGSADNNSGWFPADVALAANLRSLSQGVGCLSLGHEDSEGDWLVGTTVRPADEEVDQRVQAGPEMEWESSSDPTACLAMDLDIRGCSSSGAGDDDAMDYMPGGWVTNSPPVRVEVPTPAATAMAVNGAVGVPRATFAAGGGDQESESRALHVSPLPGVGVQGNGGAMLLAYTAPAYIAPQQIASTVGTVVSPSPVLPVAVITAGIANLVLGGAIAPMVSIPAPSVHSGGGAMLSIIAGVAALTLDGPPVPVPSSSGVACVTYFVGNGPPGKTGSTSVVNQDSVGGPSTSVMPAPVVQTLVLLGPSPGFTPVVALAVVAAVVPSAPTSPKRKLAEQLRAPVPSGFFLARQGAFAPTAEKRRPFRPPPGLAGMRLLAATPGPPASAGRASTTG